MTRRTFKQVETATIVAERAGLLSYARVYAQQIDQMVDAGKLPGVDATALKDRIRCFADGIATGLHRDGNDPAGVRAGMRALMTEQSRG